MCNSATDCWTVGYYDSGVLGRERGPNLSDIDRTVVETAWTWLITASPNSSTGRNQLFAWRKLRFRNAVLGCRI